MKAETRYKLADIAAAIIFVLMAVALLCYAHWEHTEANITIEQHDRSTITEIRDTVPNTKPKKTGKTKKQSRKPRERDFRNEPVKTK